MCSLAAGIMGAAGLFGYQQQVKQAEQQSNALKAQAEADERNAQIEGRKQEQIADNYAKEAKDLRNRQRLAQGAQRAQAGSAGIGFSGSQQDILSSSLSAYKEDQQTLLTNQRNDNYNSRVVQTNYLNDAAQKRAEADNVVSSAKAQLIPTLLSTASSIVGVTSQSSGSTGGSTGAASKPASDGLKYQNPTYGSAWNRKQKTSNTFDFDYKRKSW
ncbi:MAG: hypothetical protein ACI3U2_02310 [Anaerovibrio sp.]